MDWIGAHGKNQTGDPRRWARILDIVRYRRPAIPTSRRQSQRFCKTSPTPRTIRTALGGSIKETDTGALLEAEIEGRAIQTHALVIDEIGKEILFGALAMQQWGIRPIPDEERLDLSHYPDEFIEF